MSLWGKVKKYATVGGVGSVLGDVLGLGGSWDPQTTQASTLTPAQQAMLAKLLGTYTDESGNISLPSAPNYMQSSEIESALSNLLSGKAAYDINPEATEQYYQKSIYNPAMKEYENVTRPGFLESLGSLHSGTRANLERTSRQDLADTLSSQRSNLYYQDELARRQALESAAGRQAQGIGLGTAYNQAQLAESQIPMQNLMALLGVPAVENITTVPSPLGGLLGGIFG